MPKLNDHGLGGGGKALGVPLSPLNSMEGYLTKNDGALRVIYGGVITTIPEEAYSNSGCAIDNDIYLIGMKNNNSICYKYNVETRIWTKLSDSPEEGAKAWSVPCGTDIYYGNANTGNIYKFDTLTNEHSFFLSGTGHNLKQSRATIDGDYIYIFGGNSSSTYQTYATRVDIVNKTYTRLMAIPTGMYNQSVISGGDGYIYLFGGMVSSTTAYKYSITDNTYTTIATVPFSCYGTMIVRSENYIYLINMTSSSSAPIYAYDILTNTYRSLGSTVNARQYGVVGIIDDVIYMVGGGTTTTTYNSGDKLMIIKGELNDFSIRHLPQGVKVYTDGDVYSGKYINFDGTAVFKSETKIDKLNNVAITPTDCEYALVGSDYATIEG